jgi:peptidoglycan/LPS O-acetylase OafA/YrhL
MGSDGPANGILLYLLIAVGLSVLLAIIGFVLHGRGHFTSRGPALAWAVLTILPLFGAGAAMFTKHAADEVTGKTQSGKSEYDSRGAP